MSRLGDKLRLLKRKIKDYPFKVELNYNEFINPEFVHEEWCFTFVSIPFKELGTYVYLFQTQAEADRFTDTVDELSGEYSELLKAFRQRKKHKRSCNEKVKLTD